MKVAWLLAASIAIVIYTPANLRRGRLFSELEISNRIWTNQMWAKWHKPVFYYCYFLAWTYKTPINKSEKFLIQLKKVKIK